MNVGDAIDILDGKGTVYSAQIVDANPQQVRFKILDHRSIQRKDGLIHIAIAPTKNIDRIEWFVEKSVELGIDKITFMICERSERRVIKTDRLEKILIAAMKQSGRLWAPELLPLVSFPEVLGANEPSKFIACVDPRNPNDLATAAIRGRETLVLIGPEGDFSEQELKQAESHKFAKVSLGPNRLRTETAGIAACHTLSMINR